MMACLSNVHSSLQWKLFSFQIGNPKPIYHINIIYIYIAFIYIICMKITYICSWLSAFLARDQGGRRLQAPQAEHPHKYRPRNHRQPPAIPCQSFYSRQHFQLQGGGRGGGSGSEKGGHGTFSRSHFEELWHKTGLAVPPHVELLAQLLEGRSREQLQTLFQIFQLVF